MKKYLVTVYLQLKSEKPTETLVLSITSVVAAKTTKQATRIAENATIGRFDYCKRMGSDCFELTE